MRPYLQMLSLLLLSASGCQPEFTVSPNVASPPVVATTPASAVNFRIKKMVVSGDNGGLGPLFATVYFDYVQGRNLKQMFVPSTPTGGRESTTEYIYDNQGRLDSYRTRYERPNDNGIAGYSNMFAYEANTIEESFALLRADGQKVPYSNSNARNTYRINAEGQATELIEEGIIRFGELTSARHLYTYENGNLTKVTYLNGNDKVEFTVKYQYDDKQNPFYDWMYPFSPMLRGNKNNVVSAQVNNNTPVRTEYTYDANGLPLTKKDVTKGAVLTYEYETF